MKDWMRVLGMLRAYKQRTALLVVSVILASILSTVGITFISPLLRILFLEDPSVGATRVEQLSEDADGRGAGDGGELETTQAPVGSGTEMPVPEQVTRFREGLQHWVESRLYQGDRRAMLIRVTVLLFLLFLAKNLFAFLSGAMGAALETRVIHDIRRDLFASVQRMPLGFFTQERTGYLMSRMIIDVDMMRGALVSGATQFLSNSVMVVLALTIVILWSWKLSLATLIIVPPNILLTGYLTKKMRKGSHRTQEAMGALAAIMQEALAGIRIVKAFGTESVEEQRYARDNYRYYRAYSKMKILEALSSPVSELLGVATAIFILGFGGHLVLSGQLRPDLLIAFLGVMLWVIGPIKNLIKTNSTLQQSLAAASRVFSIMDAPKEAKEGDGRTDIDGLHRELVFEKVGFEYRDGTPVLQDVELRIPAGSSLALVGPSGAGKSTLVDLIPRFYHPTRGRILIDGVDIEEIQLGKLRSLVGVVTQEVILFHDSVANNITYGAAEVPHERVVEAARMANAHEFISALPQGYDTPVGERGTQLSGGQRQRIAIARAILRDPPILIFDEATSALDTESERLVQEAMERLMEGRTTIVIAHRLSTVVGADRIVVLEAGRVVEEGRHEELLAKSGVYRRLYDLQFHGGAGPAGSPSQLAG